MSDYYNQNRPNSGGQNTGQEPKNTGTQRPNGQQNASPGAALGQQLGDALRTTFEGVGHVVGEATETVRRELTGAHQQATGQPKVQKQKSKSEYYNKSTGQYQYNYQYKYNMPAKRQKTQPPWYGKPVANPNQLPTNYAGVAELTVGGLGLGFFGFSAIFLAFGALYVPAAFLVACGALSASLMGLGMGKHRYTKRVIAYQALLMEKNVMTFAELASAAKIPEAQVRKDFKKGMRKGNLRYVWLDKAGDTIMLGENTYNLYLQAEETRKQKEAEEAERRALMSDPEFAEMENFRTEGKRMLAEIQAANAAIPGEDITEKLDVLEETCAKIFSFVEAHPKKLPDTRKFMEYYLPTTLKMVNKYREYEDIEVQTPSITAAREEIEHSLDTINVAFSNLLDELYKDDTLDISTDIEVLQTMLEQEGLTGQKFKIEVDPNAKL